MQEYVPGVCNIGKSEIRKRKNAGYIGLILTFILYALFAYLDVPKILRIVIFIPATIAAIGFLQAGMHFCAYFGLKGVFNFGELGNIDAVEKQDFRALDRRRAWRIIIYSLIVGIAATVFALLL